MKPVRKLPADPPRHHVFIVDDHPLTRYGIVRLLNEQPDLSVCGEAADAAQAIAALGSLRPDVVLADLTMPGRGGLDFIKDLHALRPGLAVLVMSMHDESIYAERVLRAGGRGYIMKSEGGEKVLDAIREVLQGRVYVSKKISAGILDTLSRGRVDTGESRPGTLSDREFEVFQLLGQGLSTRDIAERLHLSAKTVGVHRMHIKDKLKLQSGAHLIRHAVRWAAAQQLV